MCQCIVPYSLACWGNWTKAKNKHRQRERIESRLGSLGRPVRIQRQQCVPLSEPEHHLSVLLEAPAILGDLLATIKANDEANYDAMIKIA